LFNCIYDAVDGMVAVDIGTIYVNVYVYDKDENVSYCRNTTFKRVFMYHG